MSITVTDARRFIATASHLSLRQIVVRAGAVARRRWWRTVRAKTVERFGAKLRVHTVGVLSGDLDSIAARSEFAAELCEIRAHAESICRGDFIFLGDAQTFDREIDWHIREKSQLWRYHLHYFGWVPSLVVSDAVCGASSGFEAFCRQAESWRRGNVVLSGDGWHPYTISLRTVNWLKALSGWRSHFDRETTVRDGLLASLHAQVQRLEQQLEFDVRGNHLMENARALCWAGMFFDGSDAVRWLRVSERIFEKELPEQILGDGAHFERTPGYHTTMLALLLELAVLRLRNGTTVPEMWLEAISRMACYLRAIVAPDGRLPLLKDTTYDAMASVDDLLHEAARIIGDRSLAPQARTGLWPQLLTTGLPDKVSHVARLASDAPNPSHSGYFVGRGQSGDFLVIDVGRPCPDYLPAHAHADSLSFEFHFAGMPLVVDSGVYEYTRGMWRDFFRSTRAHNTVEVDGQNSSDVWSSFRVGRRARVQVRGYAQERGTAWLTAEHDGYWNLPQRVTHQRSFVWSDGEFLLVLDALRGTGRASLRSHIHIHPRVRLAGIYEQNVHLRSAGDVYIQAIQSDNVETVRGVLNPPQGWYSEQFGRREENTVIRLSKILDGSSVFGFIASADATLRAAVEQVDEDVIARITGRSIERTIRWKLDEGDVFL